MLRLISQNPYRVLGVLSNSPLKERVGNQNRLAAFAKVGRDVAFPNDFATLIPEKPIRSSDSISSANVALNLDKDKLKYALVWFINSSPVDEMAIKHIQAGNLDKACELFGKEETFSSLINVGVVNLISGNYTSGFSNISKVIHSNEYRTAFLKALGIENLTMTEDEIAAMFIEEMLTEVPAATLLSAASNPNDKAIIEKTALEEPISTINAAIAAAKSVNSNDADANLQAGTKLMKSTKAPLKQVKHIAGAKSPQYRMVADKVAKTVLQCGINYYNNAPDSDLERPRKAMVLQAYALKIAVGQLAKERCKENVEILKRAVDDIPPAEVVIETRKVKDELRKFCSLPDKIEYSINLLNATKPLLQAIKTKLGATNPFYLSLSTQVVSNALQNLIEEVNQAQDYLNYAVEIDNKLKPVLSQAWEAITLMDSFDMEADFKANRYSQNRSTLQNICDSLRTSSSSSDSSESSNSLDSGCWGYLIGAVIGAIIGGIIGYNTDHLIKGILFGGFLGGGLIAKFMED